MKKKVLREKRKIATISNIEVAKPKKKRKKKTETVSEEEKEG